MISIDKTPNNIGLPGNIDDGREWADWLLKKADENKKTQSIPWVSVQDGMPVDGESDYPLCLVYVSIGSSSCVGYDCWDANTNQWEGRKTDEVTHWCYMDDIPAPVTEER
ncbi:hypothetical protein ID852_18590 [Xenorhabdus sp. 42]|uniref:hypothetical protein n=1 Tax=Xenorhabdus szentirmaii TaxID=290112 RepID=UPI0019BC1A68|nr:hypothetical protein [Xenorhabdus sp. 42]MBD2822649.1 hypothetical protein [Xenorhabdus sp. 42]